MQMQNAVKQKWHEHEVFLTAAGLIKGSPADSFSFIYNDFEKLVTNQLYFTMDNESLKGQSTQKL